MCVDVGIICGSFVSDVVSRGYTRTVCWEQETLEFHACMAVRGGTRCHCWVVCGGVQGSWESSIWTRVTTRSTRSTHTRTC